jgi:hypothetical protein
MGERELRATYEYELSPLCYRFPGLFRYPRPGKVPPEAYSLAEIHCDSLLIESVIRHD